MKLFVVVGLLFGAAAFAQLMPKDTAAEKNVQLKSQKTPLVYVEGHRDSSNVALTAATTEMDSRKFSSDSTVGTLIGVGAEFVGDMVKGMLSPNSAETDAVELERTRR